MSQKWYTHGGNIFGSRDRLCYNRLCIITSHVITRTDCSRLLAYYTDTIVDMKIPEDQFKDVWIVASWKQEWEASRPTREQTGVGRYRSPMKWGLTNSAACECGEPEQTADHIINSCPLQTTIRSRTLQSWTTDHRLIQRSVLQSFGLVICTVGLVKICE